MKLGTHLVQSISVTTVTTCARILTSHTVTSRNAQSFWTSRIAFALKNSRRRNYYLLKTLQKVCGGQALSRTAVYRLIDVFKDGRDRVESRHSPGRLVEATDEENVRKVKQVLDTDRRLTCDELTYDLGISHCSIYTIMRDKLNMRRVAALWVHVPTACLKTKKEHAPLWPKHYLVGSKERVRTFLIA